MKMNGRRQQDRFHSSNFEGSPTCSSKAWVEELDTFLQQHHILEYEAIKVTALHLRGKAFSWWIFESFSLRNVNIASYSSFTKALVKKFDGRIHGTHMVEVNKENQEKPLHENFHHTLLEEKPSSHTFE